MAKFKVETTIEILVELNDKKDAENYLGDLLDIQKEVKDSIIVEVFAEETNEEEL